MRERMSEGLTRDRLRLEAQRAAFPLAIVIGLLALAVLSLALLAGRLQMTMPWQDRYEVRIAVDDARGVVAGSSEVRIAGVVVGKITDVELDQGGAVLDAAIEPRFAPLYQDARLSLAPRTPLEDMHLNVTDRGSPEAGEVAEGDTLDAGRTRTAVHIGDVVNVFAPDVQAGVRRSIGELGRGLDDHGRQLRAALAEFGPFLAAARRMTHEIATRERETERLVHNLALLNEELARRDERLVELVDSAGGALAELDQERGSLGELIDELPPTLALMPRAFTTLRGVADETDAALIALRPAAQALPAGLEALRELSPDLGGAAVALEPALPDLTELATALPPLTSGLGASFSNLRPQAPRLDSITAQVLPCRLAVQKFFQWTMSVGKYYDSNSGTLRGQALASTTGAGGVPDLGLTSDPDCAQGGPR